VNRTRIRRRRNSSSASAALELGIARSARLEGLFAAAVVPAVVAVLQPALVPWPLRAVAALALVGLCASVLHDLRPGVNPAAIRRLRRGGAGAWWISDQRCSHAAVLVCSLAVGQSGWWLGFATGTRRRWVWVDAAVSDPQAYRRLSARLRGGPE
jgi:hypothetical protein